MNVCYRVYVLIGSNAATLRYTNKDQRAFVQKSVLQCLLLTLAFLDLAAGRRPPQSLDPKPSGRARILRDTAT